MNSINFPEFLTHFFYKLRFLLTFENVKKSVYLVKIQFQETHVMELIISLLLHSKLYGK